MEFFKLLHALSAAADLTIRIMGKNDKFTVSVTPTVKEARIVPIVLTGTPEELDEAFFRMIKAPIAEAGAVLHNLSQFQESLKEVETDSKKKIEEAAKKGLPKFEKAAKSSAKKPAGKQPSKPAKPGKNSPKGGIKPENSETKQPETETEAPILETPASEEIGYDAERKCRVCGCTQNDCRQCIEKTGQPCTWVEADLCSACVDEEAQPPAEDSPAETTEEPAAPEQVEEPAPIQEEPLPEEKPVERDMFS